MHLFLKNVFGLVCFILQCINFTSVESPPGPAAAASNAPQATFSCSLEDAACVKTLCAPLTACLSAPLL